MCLCHSEAYNTGTQKWSSIVQYSCTSIWDLKYTFSKAVKRSEIWGPFFFFFCFSLLKTMEICFGSTKMGNFLPGKSISPREKNQEKWLCPLRKICLLRPWELHVCNAQIFIGKAQFEKVYKWVTWVTHLSLSVYFNLHELRPANIICFISLMYTHQNSLARMSYSWTTLCLLQVRSTNAVALEVLYWTVAPFQIPPKYLPKQLHRSRGGTRLWLGRGCAARTSGS